MPARGSPVPSLSAIERATGVPVRTFNRISSQFAANQSYFDELPKGKQREYIQSFVSPTKTTPVAHQLKRSQHHYLTAEQEELLLQLIANKARALQPINLSTIALYAQDLRSTLFHREEPPPSSTWLRRFKEKHKAEFNMKKKAERKSQTGVWERG